jgi:hypothetical protein
MSRIFKSKVPKRSRNYGDWNEGMSALDGPPFHGRERGVRSVYILLGSMWNKAKIQARELANTKMCMAFCGAHCVYVCSAAVQDIYTGAREVLFTVLCFPCAQSSSVFTSCQWAFYNCNVEDGAHTVQLYCTIAWRSLAYPWGIWLENLVTLSL